MWGDLGRYREIASSRASATARSGRRRSTQPGPETRTRTRPRTRPRTQTRNLTLPGALGEKLLDAIVHLLNGRRCSALGRLCGCMPPPPSDAPLQQNYPC